MLEFQRLELLVGKDSLIALSKKKVAVFGLGGVGGYVVETLARSGIGSFILVDYDSVETSNFNRQVIASKNTLGKKKTEVFKERILSINDKCLVEINDVFLLASDVESFDFSSVDYIVDAIDTVSTKISLVVKAKELDIPIISALGFGNKLQPELVKITDLKKTSVCPLAKVLRYELKKRGITSLPVAFSSEIPIEPTTKIFKDEKKLVVGSYLPVVAVAGIMLGDYVIKEILRGLGK